MKTIAIIFLSLFLTKNCKERQPEATNQITTIDQETKMKDNLIQEEISLQYEAFSRGYFCKIIFEKDEIKVYKDRSNKEKGEIKKLSNEDLAAINEFITTFNPKDLKSMKGVEKKRTYDGAAHANFSITKKGENYNTQGFDAGNAPKPIEKIVNLMVSYSQEKE